jgi:hypothetical protein
MHLVGIEHVQRPAAVEGDEIGDVDKRVDWPKPDCGQPLLQPIGRRPVFHPAHQTQAEGRAQRLRLAEVERDFHGAREGAPHRFWNLVFIAADRSCAEVARDTRHTGAIGAIGRQVDFNRRIADTSPLEVWLANRCIRWKFNDAVGVVGDLDLRARNEHAPALDVADFANAERDFFSRNVGARRREYGLHAAARIGRATHDLHRPARPNIHHADAQAVGVGMLLGRKH